MAGASDIEWTDATWNPVSGCIMVSPGCTNCYAMRMAARLQAMSHPSYAGTTRKSGSRAVWSGHVRVNEAVLEAPLKWRSPRKVFVNSMSDLFQDGLADEFIHRVWEVMARAPWHQFQILTKRPERMAAFTRSPSYRVLPNVWLGTSVESAPYAARLSDLARAVAAVRFVSFEPLLGAVGQISLTGIDWAIVGGESGPKARPMAAEWVEEIRVQCAEQNVAFFFKQWGGSNKKTAGRTYRGRTWDAFPVSTP